MLVGYTYYLLGILACAFLLRYANCHIYCVSSSFSLSIYKRLNTSSKPPAMPSITHVRSPDPSQASGAQTGGMTRTNAISGQANINASIMTAKPHTKSDIHHHGDQDTVIYALRGSGSVVTDNGNTTTKLAPGDFCLIPAGVEHVEMNDTDDEVTWIIHRTGSKADVVNLNKWSE